jgi:hypothetical protein
VKFRQATFAFAGSFYETCVPLTRRVSQPLNTIGRATELSV